MGQILARAILWMSIIAGVWFFAQQWKNGKPSEEQRQRMMDAVRHYQNFKTQVTPRKGNRNPRHLGCNGIEQRHCRRYS